MKGSSPCIRAALQKLLEVRSEVLDRKAEAEEGTDRGKGREADAGDRRRKGKRRNIGVLSAAIMLAVKEKIAAKVRQRDPDAEETSSDRSEVRRRRRRRSWCWSEEKFDESLMYDVFNLSRSTLGTRSGPSTEVPGEFLGVYSIRGTSGGTGYLVQSCGGRPELVTGRAGGYFVEDFWGCLALSGGSAVGVPGSRPWPKAAGEVKSRVCRGHICSILLRESEKIKAWV
eukprot:561703-Hanusia_phi.AAC.1